MKKKIEKHIKGDIKGYKKEIKEDKELIKGLKMAKHKKIKKKKKVDKALKGREKIAEVMEEFSAGKLHSGSKKGPKVKKPKQALAIGFAEAKRATKDKKKKK